MGPINSMRAILAGGAAIAAVVAAIMGFWLTVGILAVALVGHGLLWAHQLRTPNPPPVQVPPL